MNSTQQISLGYADDDLQQRVSRFLSSRNYSASRNVFVEVEHGSVTLSGRVRSFYEKQVMLSTCQRVAGVLALIDHISVQPTEETRPRRRPR